MKVHDSVSVEVGLTGGHVMINVTKKDYEALKNEIKKKGKDWLSMDLDNGAEFELNVSSVQYLRMKPQGVRSLSKKGGITLSEIAEILQEPYDSLRQRLVRHKIHLEKGSDRRVFLTPQALQDFEDKLGVTPQKIANLKKRTK